MVDTLGPKAAQVLIAQGGVDVVDVRSPAEFASGHLAGSRNVPLADLKANVRAALPADRVLLVCAKGLRSRTAAQVADEAGVQGVHHLEGGTQAWAEAGLPLETPAPAAPAAPARRPEPRQPADESCEMPETGLDTVVGANLRELRTQKGLSLDQLAGMTGLSRTLLGQIELGKTAASVSMVWKIAQALDVHFSAMLAAKVALQNTVLPLAQARRLVSPDGRFSSRALYPLGDKPDAEFYELFLAPHSREDAQAHAPGTRENLIVTAGRLELKVGAQEFALGKGDAVVFTADVPHSYVNPSSQECWMYLVMTYRR
jgi:rhodanese-related sulfurtransferase/transcriptional regulator with XRE-family HTH domain